MMGQNNRWVKEFLGLLSAVVVFTTWPTPPSKFSHCSCLSGRWNSACMSDSMYRCGEMAAYTTFSPNTGVTQGFSWEWETLANGIIGCWYPLKKKKKINSTKLDTSAFQPGIPQTCNINEYVVTQCTFKQRWTFADHRIQSVTQNIIFHISPLNIACYRLPISCTTTEFPAFVLRALLQGEVTSEWVELRTEHFV